MTQHQKLKQHLLPLMPSIIEIRRAIHHNPELAFAEHDTAALVAKTLRSYGYDVKEGVGKTGIIAELDSGKPGKTVALRADIDALPMQEHAEVPYASKNVGKMHACGHDGHTATLLAVAGAMIHCKDMFTGKIRFIFQPSEEVGQGAAAMIKDGALDGVSAIFGYHNKPQYKAHVVGCKHGCLLAGHELVMKCSI